MKFWAQFLRWASCSFHRSDALFFRLTWGEDGARGGAPRLLSPALFQARVIPVLLRLFEVHEEHVRTVLLSHLEAYVGHFTQEQLKKVILPQVGVGRGGCPQRCLGKEAEPGPTAGAGGRGAGREGGFGASGEQLRRPEAELQFKCLLGSKGRELKLHFQASHTGKSVKLTYLVFTCI